MHLANRKYDVEDDEQDEYCCVEQVLEDKHQIGAKNEFSVM